LPSESIEEKVKDYITKQSINMGTIMNALRLCLVGKPMGPGVFDIIAVIGIEESVRRIRRAIETINV